MRPIDADVIVSIQTFDEMYEEWAVETMSVAEALDRFSYEGCPPTLDVESVRHGRWKKRKSWDKYVCSECGFEHDEPHNYCPNPHCGAKMDAKEECE